MIFLVDVEVFVGQLIGGGFDLDVATGAEVHFFALGQFQHQFLDEGRDVVVGADFAFPLLDAEDFLGDFDFHVLLDRDLTGQAVAAGGFALGDMAFLSRQDGAAARVDFHPALGAGAAAAARRGDEQFLFGQRLQQLATGGDFDRLFAVDRDRDIAGRDQSRAGDEDQGDQHDNDEREQRDAKAEGFHYKRSLTV